MGEAPPDLAQDDSGPIDEVCRQREQTTPGSVPSRVPRSE